MYEVKIDIWRRDTGSCVAVDKKSLYLEFKKLREGIDEPFEIAITMTRGCPGSKRVC